MAKKRSPQLRNARSARAAGGGSAAGQGAAIPPTPSKAAVLGPTTKEATRLLGRIVATLRRLTPLLIIALIGFVAGVIWLVALRFLMVVPQHTHYHANFAVYVNGEREEFDSYGYYEEIAACSSEYGLNPRGRVHMHDRVNDVVHVHDTQVTWGHFFANLDWAVGSSFLKTDQGMYQPTPERVLVFVLNGARVSRIDNRVIGVQDRLLVSYGAPATDFMAQYRAIGNPASEFDKKPDPASCSGSSASEGGFIDRLKRAVAS